MSRILNLPVFQAFVGARADEDFLFVMSFSDDAGPVDVSDVEFLAKFTKLDDEFHLVGQKFGLANNCVMFVVTAPNKVAIGIGHWRFLITATDGVFTRDLLYNSLFVVGRPAVAMMGTIYSTEVGMANVTVLSPGVVVATPEQIAASLMGLPIDILRPVINTMIQAIPDLSVDGTTLPIVNDAVVTTDGLVGKVR